MKTIRVDEEIYAELQRLAVPFVDTPNAVLRRVFGFEHSLSNGGGIIKDLQVWLIPHHRKEFPNKEELRTWLERDLRDNGKYQVMSDRVWRGIRPGAICVFHKDKFIVGHAQIKLGLQYGNSGLSRTGVPYVGWVTFDPESVCTFSSPIRFEDAGLAAGMRLSWRGPQKLNEAQYERIVALRSA